MNATTVAAKMIVDELVAMYPVGTPGMSTPDRIVAEKLAELAALLGKEIEEFEAHLCEQYADYQDVPHMYVSAGWGWD